MSAISIYAFSFRCEGVIRKDSEVWINLPSSFGIVNNLEVYSCSSTNSETLAFSSCPMNDINGSLVLKVSLKEILSTTPFVVKL